MTPLRVLIFGVHPTIAVGTDLLYAAVTKSAGPFVHHRRRSSCCLGPGGQAGASRRRFACSRTACGLWIFGREGTAGLRARKAPGRAPVKTGAGLVRPAPGEAPFFITTLRRDGDKRGPVRYSIALARRGKVPVWPLRHRRGQQLFDHAHHTLTGRHRGDARFGMRHGRRTSAAGLSSRSPSSMTRHSSSAKECRGLCGKPSVSDGERRWRISHGQRPHCGGRSSGKGCR